MHKPILYGILQLLRAGDRATEERIHHTSTVLRMQSQLAELQSENTRLRQRLLESHISPEEVLSEPVPDRIEEEEEVQESSPNDVRNGISDSSFDFNDVHRETDRVIHLHVRSHQTKAHRFDGARPVHRRREKSDMTKKKHSPSANRLNPHLYNTASKATHQWRKN